MADHVAETSSKPLLSDKTYSTTKWVAQYLLPALGTLYFALATIWGFPEPEKVIGSITALDIFLGVVLGISKKSYDNSEAKYDGALVVDTNHETGNERYSLEVGIPMDDIRDKSEILFKVKPSDAGSQ